MPTRKDNTIIHFLRKANRKAQKSQPGGVIPFNRIQARWHHYTRESIKLLSAKFKLLVKKKANMLERAFHSKGINSFAFLGVLGKGAVNPSL